MLLGFSGFVLGCVALLLSIYRQRVSARTIKELRKRTLHAQRNLRQLGNLANEVAHEIKNPITAILCSAETLDHLIGKDLDPTHQKSLKFISEYGDQILRLVSDFLDVSRAETGNIEAKPRSIELSPAVESVVGLLESNAYSKKIEVKVSIEDEDLRLYMDPKHLKQILFNLVHNAIKFTPEGGEIQIVAGQDFPHEHVRIAVRDNGCGISHERSKLLFDPYHTGGDVAEGSGIGLGLSLCKSLVELNSGEISVSSSPGVGSSFEFTAPVADAPESRKSGVIHLNPDDKPLLGQKFLVVDEHSGSREAISRLIEAWGGVVDRVGLAVDAVDALSKKTYDAVMIDDTLDGIYGHELSRILKEEMGVNRGTTVIVTADERVHPNLLEDSGADYCIEKPLNSSRLLESLIQSGKCSITH